MSAHTANQYLYFAFLSFANVLEVGIGLCNATKSQNNSHNPYRVYLNLFKFTCHRIFQVQVGDECVECVGLNFASEKFLFRMGKSVTILIIAIGS